MKSFDFTTTSTNHYTHSTTEFEKQTDHKNPFDINIHLDGHSIKPVANYITSAIAEGLKSNLLGNDINMEFLMLSVRSYSSILIDTLAHTCNDKKS